MILLIIVYLSSWLTKVNEMNTTCDSVPYKESTPSHPSSTPVSLRSYHLLLSGLRPVISFALNVLISCSASQSILFCSILLYSKTYALFVDFLISHAQLCRLHCYYLTSLYLSLSIYLRLFIHRLQVRTNMRAMCSCTPPSPLECPNWSTKHACSDSSKQAHPVF